MATNFIQEGDVLDLSIASKNSGDPAVKGKISGVCLTDTDSEGNVRLKTRGVFDLSVTGKDSSDANVAISVGDEIYLDGDTLNKDDTNGVFFGYALGAITSGGTSVIPVRLKG